MGSLNLSFCKITPYERRYDVERGHVNSMPQNITLIAVPWSTTPQSRRQAD